MGWGTAFKVAYKVASTTAKVAYDTYKAVTYVQDKVADAAVATKDAVVAGAVATKDAVVAGAVATKDAAVWAKDKAVEGAIAAKDAAVAGAVAAKDAVVAGAVAAKDAVRAKTISAREQQIRNAYGTAHENLSQEVAGCPAQECPFKKAECLRLAAAKDRALMAEHVYMRQGSADTSERQEKVESALRASRIVPLYLSDKNSKDEVSRLLGVENPEDLLEPNGTTFRARVYRKTNDDGAVEYIISYRGTDSKEDIVIDLLQGLGVPPSIYENLPFELAKNKAQHYNFAKQIGAKVKMAQKIESMRSTGNPSKVSFTGHSLAGGLASVSSLFSGYPSSTFNAAGVHKISTLGYDPAKAGAVDAYFNAADPLNGVQDNRRKVLALLSKTPIISTVVGPIMPWILANEVAGSPVLPQAYGTRRPLPLPPTKPNPGLLEGHGVPLLIDGIEMQQRNLGCQ